MPRVMFSDEHWSKLKRIMLEERIYDKPKLKLSVEGIFYCMRVGSQWRDLPKRFGDWNSIYKKFNHGSKRGK